MAVAKSFVNFEFLTEPYEVSGKMYIKVRNPKTGTERQVRWYPEGKVPGATVNAGVRSADHSNDPYWKPQKEVLGFTKGYITIFKGDTYAEIDWFRASIARYARWWGWYIISTEEIPADLPATVEPVRLEWDLVGTENGTLKSEDEVKRAVESILYEPGTSEWVGEIGQRLELDVTVVRNQTLENSFGVSNMHIMEDSVGNVFIWTTSSKSWAVGSIHHIRGTVKNFSTYKNVKQTILTRCMEVK